MSNRSTQELAELMAQNLDQFEEQVEEQGASLSDVSVSVPFYVLDELVRGVLADSHSATELEPYNERDFAVEVGKEPLCCHDCAGVTPSA